MVAHLLIRVRGTVNVNGRIQDTLRMLHLPRPNFATVVPKDESFDGMVHKVKDYVAYGEVDAPTLTQLLTQRGRVTGDKLVDDAFVKAATQNKFATVADFAKAVADGKAKLSELGPDFKLYFRLHPPVGGYEPIKRHYTVGGALGYRGKEINKLVKRMLEQPDREGASKARAAARAAAKEA